MDNYVHFIKCTSIFLLIKGCVAVVFFKLFLTKKIANLYYCTQERITNYVDVDYDIKIEQKHTQQFSVCRIPVFIAPFCSRHYKRYAKKCHLETNRKINNVLKYPI